MNDRDQRQDQEQDNPPEAVEHHSRWPGWIWAVPIAALAIVAYLGFQQFAKQGPQVTVTFPTSGGIKASQTKVKYEGMEVGEVQSVKFQKDLRHVDVVIQMNTDMEGHLGKGTEFWISGQKPSIGDLSSLKSIITGPFIGVEPHPGKKQDRYQGLAIKPVTANNTTGTRYILDADSLGTISRGSPIYYHDLEVGEVADTKLGPDSRHFRIIAFIRSPYDKLVHTNTRFWDASAVQVSMGATGPKLQLQSLPALFQGAVDFETPNPAIGGPAGNDTEFRLYKSQDSAAHAPNSRAVRYLVIFQAQNAGGLSSGAPVTLEDKRIGTVEDSTLQYDFQDKQLQARVTLALDPASLALANGAQWADNPRPQMNELLSQLISQGLRARIGSAVPLVGGKTVQLAFEQGAKQASLGAGDMPEIPAASGSGDILSAVNDVAAKIDAMPLDRIAANVHTITEHAAALSASPQVTQSLDHLDQSLANLEQVTKDAKAQTGPMLAELRRVAREAQSTVAAARDVISNSPLGQSQPGTASLGDTFYELSRAARSLRELADYLDRHPEALIRGRSG
jgi:paraquat-inducible protein B